MCARCTGTRFLSGKFHLLPVLLQMESNSLWVITSMYKQMHKCVFGCTHIYVCCIYMRASTNTQNLSVIL